MFFSHAPSCISQEIPRKSHISRAKDLFPYTCPLPTPSMRGLGGQGDDTQRCRAAAPKPQAKSHSTDLSPSGPDLSQATSRSLILPGHCRAIRELEGGGRGNTRGRGLLGPYWWGCLGA